MGDDGSVTPPPPDRDARFVRERASRSLPVSLLLLLGLLALELPLPRRFVAALPLVLAVVLSVRLLHFLRGRPGRERAWPVVTLVLTLALLAGLALQGVFYSTVRAYDECMAAAQTQIAAADCERQRPLGSLAGRLILG